MILHHLNNPFENWRVGGDKFAGFALIHINELKANNEQGDYDDMIAATQLAYDEFVESLTLEALEKAFKEGKTINVDEAVLLIKDFASKKEVTIAYMLTRGTAEYEEFYPRGISEYNTANKTSIYVRFSRYTENCKKYAAQLGVAIGNEAQALLDAFVAARNIQLEAKGEVKQLDSDSDNKRDALAIQLFKNLAQLLFNYIPDTERVKDFFVEPEKKKKKKKTPPEPPIPTAVIVAAVKMNVLKQIGVDLMGTDGKKVTIDWGDGTTTVVTLESGLYQEFTHNYAQVGNYTIRISGYVTDISELRMINSNVSAVNIPEEVNLRSLAINNNMLSSLAILATQNKMLFLFAHDNELDQQSVNSILIMIESFGTSNGQILLQGGSNSAPSGQGIAAMNALIARGWTVTVNQFKVYKSLKL